MTLGLRLSRKHTLPAASGEAGCGDAHSRGEIQFPMCISGVSDIQTDGSCDLFLSAERGPRGGESARRGFRDPAPSPCQSGPGRGS